MMAQVAPMTMNAKPLSIALSTVGCRACFDR